MLAMLHGILTLSEEKKTAQQGEISTHRVNCYPSPKLRGDFSLRGQQLASTRP